VSRAFDLTFIDLDESVREWEILMAAAIFERIDLLADTNHHDGGTRDVKLPRLRLNEIAEPTEKL
jgi:hypothetical protein